MGRLAAYLGPRTRISNLLEGGSYSLAEQAREYPDGFGLAWYPDDEEPDPVGLWAQRPASRAEPLLTVPRRYSSECMMAAIRSTLQLPASAGGQQPFISGQHLFAFDGELERYGEVFLRPLRDRLSDEAYQSLRTNEPEELLFATWLDALNESEARGPEAMASALEKMVGTVGDVAAAAGVGASFAVVATDGHCLITLRAATQGPPPALYTIVAGEDAPVPESARVIASEPLFPGAWSSLDPHSLVIFTLEEDGDDVENTDNLPTQTGQASEETEA